MPDAVGSEPQYDVFAEEFSDHARDGFYNAHYDRPACLELLGEVAGRTVLDAACGPGLYAGELVARGARVIGLDQSPRIVELSRQHVPSGDFRVRDLADDLDLLPDQSVDLHPTGDWLRNGGNYFGVRVIEEVWSRGWRVRYWLAPLERTCEELHQAGFLIERLLEPRPRAEAAAHDRERYERLHREPTGFLAIRAVPDPRR